MIHINAKPVVAGLIGFIIAVVAGYALTPSQPTHPVGTSFDTVVHVHGDFRMYINDERIRFTDNKYQSSTAQTHHVSLHFHDGNDEVIHRHADNVTLTEFFDSIGIKVNNECITMDTGEKFCTDNSLAVQLFVNGTVVEDIESYIFAEEDRILLYYGDITNPKINEYVAGITDLSCLYSGTCPERGTPPTEGCGLTCEVADLTTHPKTWLHKLKDLFTRY